MGANHWDFLDRRLLVTGLFVVSERRIGPGFLFGASLFVGLNIADDGLTASLNIDLPDRNLLWATPACLALRLDR